MIVLVFIALLSLAHCHPSSSSSSESLEVVEASRKTTAGIEFCRKQGKHCKSECAENSKEDNEVCLVKHHDTTKYCDCQIYNKGLTKYSVPSFVPSSNNMQQQVVSLDEHAGAQTCDPLPQFPTNFFARFAGLFRKKIPIMCGCGSPDCYCLKWVNGAWQQMPTFSSASSSPYSDAVNIKIPGLKAGEREVLAVSSGVPDPMGIHSFYTYDGQTWRTDQIANMPDNIVLQCLVRIGDYEIMSIGGFLSAGTGQGGNRTYFYDAKSNRWTLGPYLLDQTPMAACGLWRYKNPATGKTDKIVVALTSGPNFPVMLLNLREYKKHGAGWTRGPNFWPAPIHNRAIQFENDIYVFGPLYVDGNPNYQMGQLYALTSPNGNWTVRWTHPVRIAAKLGAGMFIPDHLANCRLA